MPCSQLVVVAFNYRLPIMIVTNAMPTSATSVVNPEGSIAALRSRRSSRSATPGEGGYGFESNVKLRSNRSLATTSKPAVPGRTSVALPTMMVNDIEYAIAEAGYADEEAPRARERPRGRPADLPRLIIPGAIRPLPVPSSNGVSVQRRMEGENHVLAEDQRSHMPAVNAGDWRPIPAGPRPLQKIVVPKSSSNVRSYTTAISAPATQTAWATKIAVSTLPEDDYMWSSSPLPSSVVCPISKNTSESVNTGISVVKPDSPVLRQPTFGQMPRRYQNLNTHNRLSVPVRDSSLPQQPRPHYEGIQLDPAFRAPVHQTSAAAYQGHERSRFSMSSYGDHHSLPTASCESISGEDSVIVIQRDDEPIPQPVRPVPSARSGTYGRVTSTGHSDGSGKSVRDRVRDRRSMADRRRASTIRTSVAAPTTASSMSTFEIVQIPQLPARVTRVREG